jgi:hypothetical protein
MAMTAKADFVSVGAAMAADVGQKIVWQVSLYRMKSEISCCDDWRDMSTAHSFMLETAYKEMTGGDVTHFVLPATAEDATAAGAGDWVVDLPHWTQLNMETNTRRRIRRCIITDPPSATSAEA